jgi:hypothetical protein
MADEEQIEIFNPFRAAVEFVSKRRSEWETSMQIKRRTCARLDKRYKNYRDDLEFVDDVATATPRANLGVPLAGETVDTAVARSHDVLLGQRPYGRIGGAEFLDDYKAQIHQAITDIQQAKPWFVRNTGRVVRDAIKYGLGIGKMHFKRVSKRVPVPQMLFGIRLGTRMEERDVIQTPYLEHVHIQDAFFPLDAPSFDDAEGVIHRIWSTTADLKRAKDALGFPLYDQAAVARAMAFKDSHDTDPELQTEYTTRKIEKGGLHKDDRHALLEYTGRLPERIARELKRTRYPDADIYGDWIVAIIEGVNIPLRAEPDQHPQRGWIGAKIIDDPGYIWGVSLIEAVEKLGLTIDQLYCMVLDNVNFVINKEKYVNELAGVDTADMVSQPGKIYYGKRPYRDAMEVIQTPDISQSIFLLIQNFLMHYKEYTGIQNPILGATTPGRQTATEFAGLVAHSATRLGQFDRMLEDTLMRPMFESWTLLNQKFLDQDFLNRMLKDTQPTMPRVAAEDMVGVFDYFFDGASRAESDAVAVGQYLQALQINATQPVPIFDPLFIARKLAERWRWASPEQAINPMFKDQFMMYQQLAALKNVGEAAKALTPEQQKAASPKNKANPAKQGAAAQPENTGTKDFRSALAAVKEAALPQGITEGQL